MGNDFRGIPGLKNYSGFIQDYYELKLNILSFQIKLSIVGVEIKKWNDIFLLNLNLVESLINLHVYGFIV